MLIILGRTDISGLVKDIVSLCIDWNCYYTAVSLEFSIWVASYIIRFTNASIGFDLTLPRQDLEPLIPIDI